MPTVGQAYPVDDAWRSEVERRLAFRGWSRADLAKAISCPKSAITNLLNGTTKQSALVPKIEKKLGMRMSRHRTDLERRIDDVVAQLDDMQKARYLERGLALLEEQQGKPKI